MRDRIAHPPEPLIDDSDFQDGEWIIAGSVDTATNSIHSLTTTRRTRMPTELKTRKPKARQRDVVIGCLEERSCMVGGPDNVAHRERLLELLDELKRSLNGKKDEGEE